MAILTLIPEGDPNLTTHLNKHLRTNKTEQQNNTFWFTTPEKPGKPEEHTPYTNKNLQRFTRTEGKSKL